MADQGQAPQLTCTEAAITELTKAVVLALEPRLQQLSEQLAGISQITAELTRRTGELECRVSDIEDGAQGNGVELTRLRELVADQQTKLEDLENRSRRDNLRLLGIPEAVPERSLRRVLERWMSPMVTREEEPDPVKLERAHRLGAVRTGEGRPRIVIVKFLNSAQKEAFLQHYRLHKEEVAYEGVQVRVYQDYSAALAAKRRQYSEVCSRLIERKYKFQVRYPAVLKVWHNGQWRTHDTPGSAMAWLNGVPEQHAEEEQVGSINSGVWTGLPGCKEWKLQICEKRDIQEHVSVIFCIPPPDVDECRQTPRLCGSGRCENSAGSYHCVCPTGFRLGPQDNECVDINECENPSSCPGQECVNTAGAFQCRPCQAGYRLHNRKCSDINECQTEAACGSGGRCINTDGSYRCECHSGYRLNSDGTHCADIIECLEGDFCFPRGECLNTEGSYTCLCAEGFTTSPDKASCIDKDECRERALCGGGRCRNTEGSFDCVCQTGFRASADKTVCQDIDECGEQGGSLCGAQRCENTLGSYKCIVHCDAGYRASASGGCTDVDECLEYGPALCGTRSCENTPGSYKCVTDCEPGYQATVTGECIDINECLNSSICGEHAMCQNLIGSYQCLCDQGYEGARDGRHCVDVNECLTLQSVCGTALCENVEGSFLCICPSSAEEFDPMTGKCTRLATAARPLFPSFSHPDLSGLKECYYDLEDAQVCENILSRNVTWEQCCCSIGEGWGTSCQIQKCPTLGSVDYQSLCPGGTGYLMSSQGFTDADECLLFGPQICKSGVCVNKVPGYACYCANGYYYEIHQLECIDNDECREEEEACIGGRCINTMGSYYCTCVPPLILDDSQRRCIANTSQTLGMKHSDYPSLFHSICSLQA
ncbi:latent-transforming growth factor beta-binding protein 4 [Microcaecilia unicolor]|uniref:Latent-transforming growth factor beta-binding protein 4-like n=1 Tax=Microcaecilia unicolor TaxID=1415580 RepID=A0A6P7WWI2_9AMPH|nr:latent-transforming growth factor beta-binding protein 4-like [Microcaecilia unicolor]